jgi:hypothetical protein
MPTGQQLYDLAITRKGEKYVNVLVPKDNPNWHGPWDCAEFASWVVYQCTGKLYGCTNNNGKAATTEAYSVAWVRDAENGILSIVSQADANVIPGVILLRRPPMPGHMGHVAISSGKGKTIEAAGVNLGVREGKIEGRQWHYCVKVPEVAYSASGPAVIPKPMPFLLSLSQPPISGPIVKKIKQALKEAGVDPGEVNDIYDDHATVAVYAFQKMNKLVADGVVGPATAKKLKVPWP